MQRQKSQHSVQYSDHRETVATLPRLTLSHTPMPAYSTTSAKSQQTSSTDGLSSWPSVDGSKRPMCTVPSAKPKQVHAEGLPSTTTTKMLARERFEAFCARDQAKAREHQYTMSRAREAISDIKTAHEQRRTKTI